MRDISVGKGNGNRFRFFVQRRLGENRFKKRRHGIFRNRIGKPVRKRGRVGQPGKGRRPAVFRVQNDSVENAVPDLQVHRHRGLKRLLGVCPSLCDGQRIRLVRLTHHNAAVRADAAAPFRAVAADEERPARIRQRFRLLGGNRLERVRLRAVLNLRERLGFRSRIVSGRVRRRLPHSVIAVRQRAVRIPVCPSAAQHTVCQRQYIILSRRFHRDHVIPRAFSRVVENRGAVGHESLCVAGRAGPYAAAQQRRAVSRNHGVIDPH